MMVGIIIVGITLLLSFFISLLMSGLVGIVSGLVVYFILKQGKDDATQSTPSNEPAPKNDSEQGIELLLVANITLRKAVIPEKIRDVYEEIIDQLIALLPRVNESSPDGELAWVINRMATEYLPQKSIKPYLALSEGERQDKDVIEKVIESLSGMKSELEDVKDILSQRKTNEFNTKAKFLKQRFNI